MHSSSATTRVFSNSGRVELAVICTYIKEADRFLMCKLAIQANPRTTGDMSDLHGDRLEGRRHASHGIDEHGYVVSGMSISLKRGDARGIMAFWCNHLETVAHVFSTSLTGVRLTVYVDEQCNLVSTGNVLFCYKKLDSVA